VWHPFADKQVSLKMKSVDEYREIVVKDLFKTKTMQNAWPIWKPQIDQKTRNLSDPDLIFDLGDHLSGIFLSTAEEGRGQNVLSAAGHAWEGLVTLYLNLVFSGTNAVAMKQKKSLVPKCLLDATSINYGSDQTNTESDVVVVVFPDGFDFTPLGLTVPALSKAMSRNLNRFEMGVIQCKTNWNDNSQIPMLWDMIYRSRGFDENNISIGRNGHFVDDLRKFTYSFATVPTQKDPFKSSDMAVKRVRNLTGGNFWGKTTEPGIALGLKEIFSKNFRAAFAGRSIGDTLGEAISQQKGAFAVVKSLDITSM